MVVNKNCCTVYGFDLVRLLGCPFLYTPNNALDDGEQIWGVERVVETGRGRDEGDGAPQGVF
jgi:hypothetical protein